MKNSFLSVPQAAMLCSLSRGTIWKYVKSGDLKASMTPGGHYRIHNSDLDSFMIRKKIHPAARYEPEKYRILIVDDDPQIQDMLVVVLAKNGFKTETAGDGFEAGVKLMSFKPGLIILDLFMPWMDGFEVCKRIKGDKTIAHTKILAITGYDTPENRNRILAMGADYYMAKPLDRKALLEKITTLLEYTVGVEIRK